MPRLALCGFWHLTVAWERRMSFVVELPLSEYNKDAFAQFDPTAAFQPGNALAMAWMSQLAYETRLPDKMRGIIARKGEALIIAFAGTDPLNLLNWVSDFYLGQRTADAHAGFRDAAAAV